MSSFKIKGLDKLQKQLKEMEKGAKELSKKKHIPLEDLFHSSFMRKYTSFSSINELFKAGGFEVESQEDFESLQEEPFNKHISSTTKFSCWDDMLETATDEYVTKKLGL